MTETKTCKTCGQTKPVAEFNRVNRKRTPAGGWDAGKPTARCKACLSKYKSETRRSPRKRRGIESLKPWLYREEDAPPPPRPRAQSLREAEPEYAVGGCA